MCPWRMATVVPIRMKVYGRSGELLVAAADADLVGKIFREGDLRLEVNDFYAGEEVSEEDLVEQVKSCTMGNFVGEETVAACMRAGLVSEDGIIRIGGVPHAQLYVM